MKILLTVFFFFGLCLFSACSAGNTKGENLIINNYNDNEQSVLLSQKGIHLYDIMVEKEDISMGAVERMDFTCIGDNVNIAARLEGANKEYRTKSLITENVYNKVRNIYLCREIDLMTVKGKKEPVKIYKILEEKSKIKKDTQVLKEGFEKGLKAYREKKVG